MRSVIWWEITSGSTPNHLATRNQKYPIPAAAVLDYGDRLRCALGINHSHPLGANIRPVKCGCGTKGAAYLHLGVNLNYPEEADILEVNLGQGWENIALEGSWFTESFGYRMAQLQRYANGEESELISNANDAWHTMALIEAAYESSGQPATRIQTEMK